MPGPVTRSGHRVLIAVVLATLAGAVAIVRPGATNADQTSPLLAPYQDRLQQATDRALEFLAKSQRPDGSFPTEKNDTAVTSLSVMAFLACGHTPGQGPYGEVINRGIDVVLASQQPNGLLVRDTIASGPMYSHGASTLMLLEVSGMVDPARQARIDEALAKALKLILAAQSIPKDEMNKGGWRYQPTSGDSDISCTGWQLMSLRSARNNGALVPTEAIEEGVKYILKCRHESGGFTYQPGGGPGLARTGTALLALELCGRHGDRTTLAAGEWILQNLPPGAGQGDFFYYGLYYCSQGMFQLGDKYWEGWAQRMYDIMLASQQKDGSWPLGGGTENTAGPCYSTAMTVLALSVSYRQLPIYQR
jgi:hypothetical protein